MKVGLLECDDVAGRFAGVDGGYREMFAALLPGLAFSYYDALRGQIPASPSECDAWLCTGSKYSVYDQHAWIEGLSGFIRKISEADRKFVGICFGHQMLAHAMGGVVAKASQGWGVGVLPLQVLKPEPWMQPPKSEVRIQHMHQDQVQKLPANSVLLGSSPHCEVGMFRVGASMLGVEGHPEFTVPFGRALISARTERIGAARASDALKSLDQATDATVVGSWLANFLRA